MTVEIDSEKDVLDSLKKIPNIKEAHQLQGVYDFIIHVEAETMQELKNSIEKRIRVIEKIRSTMALICT